MRSEYLLALALSAEKDNLERRSRSFFQKSCALAHAQQAMSAAQFGAHFQNFLTVFRHKFMHFFNVWLPFQRSTFEANKEYDNRRNI